MILFHCACTVKYYSLCLQKPVSAFPKNESCRKIRAGNVLGSSRDKEKSIRLRALLSIFGYLSTIHSVLIVERKHGQEEDCLRSLLG